jgi:hypothetical protein
LAVLNCALNPRCAAFCCGGCALPYLTQLRAVVGHVLGRRRLAGRGARAAQARRLLLPFLRGGPVLLHSLLLHCSACAARMPDCCSCALHTSLTPARLHPLAPTARTLGRGPCPGSPSWQVLPGLLRGGGGALQKHLGPVREDAGKGGGEMGIVTRKRVREDAGVACGVVCDV